MATFQFVLPELGEGMEAGDVVQVLVTVGDTIAAEQPVLELETDKAVVEVPTPVSGTVKAIHVQAGDKAAVGQLLLTVEMLAPTVAAGAAPRPPVAATGSLSSTSENGENRAATDNAVPLQSEPPAPTAPVPPALSRHAARLYQMGTCAASANE